MAHSNIDPLPASRDPSPRTSALESTTRSSRHRATIHRPRTVIRPLPFFHPTRASFAPHHSSAKEQIEGGSHAHWSSRASRKHRYSRRLIRLAHPPAAKSEGALRNDPLREGFSLLEQRVRHTEDQVKVQGGARRAGNVTRVTYYIMRNIYAMMRGSNCLCNSCHLSIRRAQRVNLFPSICRTRAIVTK